MFDKIIPYEKDVFFMINGIHTPYFDNAMWLYSETKIWIPLAILIIINIIYRKNWKQWLTIIAAITIMFILCDQFSSHILKPLIARPRPTHYPGIMEYVKILHNHRGGKYGFISGHATNAFGFATLSSLIFKYKPYTVMIIIWASIMAYSRIYMGLHFLSDVIAGAILGILIGFAVYKIYLYVTGEIQQQTCDMRNKAIYPHQQIKVMSIVITGYIFLLFTVSGHLILFLK